MDLQNWQTQLRKGLLDLCVLNLLSTGERYGYVLVQAMKRMPALAIREGTVYPVLARLLEEGLVSSEVRPSDEGPPRKYYMLTPAGRQALRAMNGHWENVENAVRRSSEDGGGDEQ